MPKGLVNESSLNNIADAINVLNGTEGTYAPSEMGAEIIDAIPSVTKSGDIVSITDAAAYPAESVVTTLEPVQDLHGYDNPWPAGGGKNLLNDSLLVQQTTGLSNRLRCNLFAVQMKQGDSCVLSFVGNDIQCVFAMANTAQPPSDPGEYPPIVTGTDSGWQNSGYVYTASVDGWITLGFRKSDDSTIVPDDISNPQLELGSTATSYAPYSNICPISGHTGVELTRTGKNLFDVSTISWNSGIRDDSGAHITPSLSHYTDEIMVKPSTTYTISGFIVSASNSRIYFLDKNKNWLSRSGQIGTDPYTFTTLSDCGYIEIQCSNTYDLENCQLELGSTATTYEAYKANTFPVTFPAAAGTVYGGEVDFVNGKLRVTKVSNIYDGSMDESWADYPNSSAGIFAKSLAPNPGLKLDGYITSNYLQTILRGATWSNYDNFISQNNSRLLIVVIKPITTVSELRQYLSQNPLQVCYELATPIEYDLTPQQIELFKQYNNLFADNGTTEVKYKVDLATFISELQASAANVSALTSTRSLPTLESTEGEDAGEIEDADEPVVFDEEKESEPIEEEKDVEEPEGDDMR